MGVNRAVTLPAGKPLAKESRGDGRMTFVIAAIVAALSAVGLTIWLGFRIGGDTVTTAVSDIGQAIPALGAAGTCSWAAAKSNGRLRWAWTLLAASAGCWGIGEVIWSVYRVALDVQVPFPSAADAGFLGAVPLAVAGVLALPSAPSRRTTRGRALLDGSMVALSLLFVSWALGLGQLYHQSAASPLAQWIGLAYPIGDIVILTVLFLALQRTTRSQRSRLLLILGGLAANAFSDSAFAFTTASGTFATSSYLLSVGWVYGYLLIALAALWPARNGEFARDEGPISFWQVMVPWVGLVAVVFTAALETAAGQQLDGFLVFPGAGLAILLMTSQLLSYRDSLALLAKSVRAEMQLRSREHLLDEIIEHTPVGLARVGPDLRITNVNGHLGSLFHTRPQVLLGSRLGDYLAEEDVARIFAGFKTIDRVGAETTEAASSARRTDGSRVWVHWSVTAVRDPGGAIDYYLAMFEDIEAQHEAETAAMANLASLERLNRLKSEFVSMVSHEFRTALTGIQGFSEMMSDQELPPADVMSFARDINSDAQRLTRMITEMLDLDRMEAGRMTLHIDSIDLNMTSRAAVERARVTTARHVLTMTLDPNLPRVSGDSDRLLQVIANLLSNAIKYSPDGGEIVLKTQATDNLVEVTVRDHGIGIPADFIDRLFGQYERYETQATSKIVGTGLGLAIARRIVEMHGGRIWVESNVGAGSEFHVTIPIGAGKESRPPA
jgi:PAS domain S-box-containing protein